MLPLKDDIPTSRFPVVTVALMAQLLRREPGQVRLLHWLYWPWVAAEAQALRAKLVDMRRDFHMHPELSNREERTARVVAERLEADALGERVEHPPARLAGQRVEDLVERHGILNHVVENRPCPDNCQPLG